MNEKGLLKEIESVLNQIERLYPRLYKLESTLKELGLDLGEPLPENGTLHTPADYGRAICGLAKFLLAMGQALIGMEEENGCTDSL